MAGKPTSMRKVTCADRFTPPESIPPLSSSTTVTVAMPTPPDNLKLKVPLVAMAGLVANRFALESVTTNRSTFWADSSAGPVEIFVANPLIACAGAFCAKTMRFVEREKLGASFNGFTVKVKEFVVRAF